MTATSEPVTCDEMAALVNAVLPHHRYEDGAYLDWLYNKNPAGPAIVVNRRDEDTNALVGHNAAYMLPMHCVEQPHRRELAAVSCNSAADPTTRRKGLHTNMLQEMFATARERNIIGVTGCTNNASTKIAVRHWGYRFVCPLPVYVIPRALRPLRFVEHVDVTPTWLDSPDFSEIISTLPQIPQFGYRSLWDVEYAQWRLSSPNTPPFMMHISPDLVAVSTQGEHGRIRLPVILKVWKRTQQPTVRATRFLGSIAAHYHAPAVVYAGINADISLHGIKPPRRFLPSPLNYMWQAMGETPSQFGYRADTFEMLDFDVY